MSSGWQQTGGRKGPRGSTAAPTYERFLRGTPPRFNHKNTVFARRYWDPRFIELNQKFGRNQMRVLDRAGYRPEDFALRQAAWYGEDLLSSGSAMGLLTRGMYNGLEGWAAPVAAETPTPPSARLVDADPARNAALVKRAARLFGADLVGVCEVNPAWVYSHVLDADSREEVPLELPEGCAWAVVMAVEEDYTALGTSPSATASAAVGAGYSRMAFTAGLLGQYLRSLGYQAAPCGNDTALSVPLAVDAGLGELGRFGLLITKEFGPRVRLCKVLTDLPLAPDPPVDLGVQDFCEECKRCAEACPSRAIPSGGRTSEPLTISNNGGLEKWMVDGERCFGFWAANGVDCTTCRAVCPWNKPNTWYHRAAVEAVKAGPRARRTLIWADDVLYGRGAPARRTGRREGAGAIRPAPTTEVSAWAGDRV